MLYYGYIFLFYFFKVYYCGGKKIFWFRQKLTLCKWVFTATGPSEMNFKKLCVFMDLYIFRNARACVRLVSPKCVHTFTHKTSLILEMMCSEDKRSLSRATRSRTRSFSSRLSSTSARVRPILRFCLRKGKGKTDRHA